ncbi:3-hydroxybutyryl-CoA dehydrogenase [Caballeronia hypogeia]|uniref:L-gulonate 3-dehydrogenase n=1 Tax=Caballeronia hypogeia TaxID=1777140 RepID=A0A158BXB3_9BURK|nr:3-hydroxybutyryl-CoA dehydrogenase [Caballeronia hypogeia]SAK74743.1 3-hydroxybutyryl-CoA dehydrogenase [Caballeronia hypogeia]
MTDATQIGHVHVVGAGRMGQGIALAFAFAGLRATLIDFKERDAIAREAFARSALDGIARQLHAQAALGRITQQQADEALSRIDIVDRARASSTLGQARVVFEAVPEVLDAKRDVFAWLGECADTRTIIASTTSTFLVTDLQRIVTHPDRLLNAHWLNPAHLMPLVEVSRSDATDAGVVSQLVELLKRIGKTPVVCAPSAGYIVPRIQALAMNEAARMVEEGVASAEEIDTAIRTGFGLRFAVLGLLEFIDWGGCDILYYASHYLAKEKGERFLPARIVSSNMHESRKGLLDGAGFYDYGDVDTAAYVKSRLEAFGRMLEHLGLAPVFNGANVPSGADDLAATNACGATPASA